MATKTKGKLLDAIKAAIKGSSEQKKWLIICAVSVLALLVWWIINLVSLIAG